MEKPKIVKIKGEIEIELTKDGAITVWFRNVETGLYTLLGHYFKWDKYGFHPSTRLEHKNFLVRELTRTMDHIPVPDLTSLFIET
jgi:hypothetical protein